MSFAGARRGVALVAALVFLTLLGTISAALVASSIGAQRATRLGFSAASTLAAAEAAVNTVLADPSGYQLATLPLGQTRYADFTLPQAPPVQVAMTRLSDGVLWLVSDATVPGVDSAERRVNLVAQFPSPGPLPLAAIESHGDVTFSSDVTVATDTTGDADCAARPGTPQVVIAPGTIVEVPQGTSVDARGAARDSNSYFLMGWQRSLLARAIGVRRVMGDTTVGGGSFDGVMLVDGALTIAGPWIVTGLVVATGPIRTTAGGLSVTGALLSAFSGPGPAIDLGGAALRFAPCVVAASVRRTMVPILVPNRPWSELF